jgi:plastocyanin
MKMLRFSMGERVGRLRSLSSSASERTRRRSAKRFALGVESLEERALLATMNVSIIDDSFSPSAVTINVGDTIHWIFTQGTHSTTAVAQIAEAWDSGLRSPPSTYDHTFTVAGVFPYYCVLHGNDNGNGTAGGMSGRVTVNSTANPTLQSIAVTPASPSIGKGGSQQFTATGNFSNGTTQNLTSSVVWASAPASVATITAGGLATGVAAGSATISATMSGITGSTGLTVTAPTVRSIVVTPAGPTIGQGKTQQFTAMATLTDNSTQDLTSSVTWASANTAVATINAVGLATGVGTGTSSISAIQSGITGSTLMK